MVRRRRRGYTLLELALVCALLLVAAAVATPTVWTLYNQHRLSLATDSVREAWALARGRAIEEGRPYRFAVEPDTGRFRVAPDDPDFWPGPGPSSDSGRPPLVIVKTLPGGVRFVTNGSGGGSSEDADDLSEPVRGEDDGSGNWTPVAIFMPDGTAQEDAQLDFQGRSSRTATLRLRGLTGNASLQYGYAGEGN